jgi:acyl-CoA thioesterase-1
MLVAASAMPARAACVLAVMGDSLTAGYELPFEDAYPATLQRYLASEGLDCEVQNHGVSGDTSAGGLARLDWVLGGDPTHLILELGANDGLRALPVENMRENLDAIISGAKAEGVHVYLMGMLAPPNLGKEYTAAYASVFSDLAERHDLLLYPFFMEGVVAEESLLQDDGLHPTADGVAEIVRRTGPSIMGWVKSTQ